MDDETPPVAPGTLIGGRYRVEQLLGRGGMGAVYAGRHLELQERVAIKFLHREHAAHADRFFREARAASRIRSEHVVRIYDVGRMPSGEPYIVMEHLEGGDLADRLEELGTLDLTAAADILIDVCEALAQAHALGIVHRDLKPANIYLAREVSGDVCVKLLDFGVAKVPDADALTRTATLLGSPVYMSPEQLMGSRSVDPRSDIWSLGVVLYELLTATLPFEGDSIVHQGILVREMSTPQLTAQRPELPDAIDAVVERCLAKEQRDRYTDVGALAEALAPFASPSAQATVPRIRRILSAVRESKPDLASTLPFDEEPPEPKKATRPSGGSARDSKKSQAATRISGVGKLSSPTEQVPVPPASDPVALASSHAQRVTTVPDARAERRRRGWLIASGAVALTAVTLLMARELLTSPPMPLSSDPSPATSTAVAPDAPPGAPEAPVVAVAPSTSQRVEAAPASSNAPRAQSTTRHSHGKQVASATPPPAAAPNCNPPYVLRDGVRVPKPECMR